jgi:hypothetical protein
MRELVFLLEEASAQAMLEGLVPRLIAQDLPYRFIPFEGKPAVLNASDSESLGLGVAE